MSLVNPDDTLERQNAKLLQISEALMRRVEYDTAQSGAAYAQFERAALLEKRVRERTRELERTLDLLHESNAQLAGANREAEAARRNLADAIETVSEGFALFDPSDVLVMCNSRFCRDFRDTATNLVPGLPFSDYVAQISRSRYLSLPEGETIEGWAKARMRKHQDRHVMFNVQLRHDRWLQVSEHRTANGGTVVVQTDVTDIVRLERQERARLKDKQARMIRATLDHLDQGVCIFDENARLVGWNQKIGALLGLPARRWHIGASIMGLLDRLDNDVVFTRGMSPRGFRDWATSSGLRQPVSFEIRRGEQTILQVSGRSMPDRGFLISCTDVTAEREAARELTELNEILEQRVMERTLELEDALNVAERANASKSRFVAAASHDLLQPLSAAKLFLSSLSERVLAPHDMAVLVKAETALSGAEQIIDALLDISKLDSDMLTFDIRPTALDEVLLPLRDEMEMAARAKGLDLRLVRSGLVVDTDPAYLRRIVQNLMANAVRYTETGRILVGVRRRGSSVRIEVWDTGPGIDEDDQGLIFEEFKRLDASASRNDGLGLGLAIVERACSRLGHPLGLNSVPGRGSCFMVSLPVSRENGPLRGGDHAPVSPNELSQFGLIALLVENDTQLRRALSGLVESWGVHVIEAEDSAAALALLDDVEITPDVLLLDYQLGPGLTGSELCEVIRARHGAVPAAIISADRSEALREACEQTGTTLLRKPLNRMHLGQFLTEVAQLGAGLR